MRRFSIRNSRSYVSSIFLPETKIFCTGLQKKNGLSFLAAVGTIVPELCQCSASYQAALSALSYRIYGTDTKIFDSGIICHQLPQESPRSIDSAPLADAILNGDTTRIKDYCSAFFDSLFFVRMPPPNYIFGMFLFLISNVQKDIAIKSSHPVSFPEFTFDDLNILPSVSELKDWLIDFFLNYCRTVFTEYRDLVSYWLTFNEINMLSGKGVYPVTS